ncbi:MAG: response regulator [Acidobacteriota bacterium]
MENILIVDDDRNFILSLTDGLNALDLGYKIITAGNGREALVKLESEKVDLIITDIRMPEMDGFELLANLSKNHSDIPIIVMTAFGTPEIEKNLKNFGLFQYLEKPLDFNVLTEKIKKGIQSRSAGFLKGISLMSFIQLISSENKTCTLKIQSKKGDGKLYFLNGSLIDGEIEELSGREAVYEIISMESAEIEIDGKCDKDEDVIDASIDFLLLEATRKMDEIKRTKIKKLNKKETKMDVQKLNDAVDKLKSDMGEALLATDVWIVEQAQSIAGYNTQPKATALFNKIVEDLGTTLKKSGFPGLGQQFTIGLEDNKMVVIVLLGKYRGGLLIDESHVQLGLLLNVILPEYIEAVEAAVA